MKSGVPGVKDYAVDRLNHLLTRLAFEAHRASKAPGADEIHDLRVSVRCFSQALTTFADFLPKWKVKKIDKRLKRMLRLTSDIRNRDIALEYLAEKHHPEHRNRLEKERLELQRQFSEMLRRWTARDFSAKWRTSLSLDTL